MADSAKVRVTRKKTDKDGIPLEPLTMVSYIGQPTKEDPRANQRMDHMELLPTDKDEFDLPAWIAAAAIESGYFEQLPGKTNVKES